MKRSLSLLTGLLLLAATTLATHAANVTFGTGGNQFDMEFVEIGDAGNGADPDDGSGQGGLQNFGSVSYVYNIGKYEISRDMITKASTEGSLGITLRDFTPYGGNGADRPAAGISWFEAATFVNWLNTSSGGVAAYKFDGGGNFQLWNSGDAGYDASNFYRNSLATYWLPSVDEWYKAAYYDPNTGTYFDYATGSDTAPTAVTNGTSPGTAVYNQVAATGPADIMQAGGLSPYGTMAQNGNVWEWEETAYDLTNSSTGENRGLRNGAWVSVATFLQSSVRIGDVAPTHEDATEVFVGFRVAAAQGIPEPSRALLLGLGIGAIVLRRRRS